MTIKDKRLINWQHLTYTTYYERYSKWKDVSKPYQWRWGVRIKEWEVNLKEQYKLGNYVYSYNTYITRVRNGIPLDKKTDARWRQYLVRKNKNE
jgi:hypothetical protein